MRKIRYGFIDGREMKSQTFHMELLDIVKTGIKKTKITKIPQYTKANRYCLINNASSWYSDF